MNNHHNPQQNQQINFAVAKTWEIFNENCQNALTACTNNVNQHESYYKIHEIHESKLIAHMALVSMGEFYLLVDANLNKLMFLEVVKIEKDSLVTLLPLGATTKLSLNCKITAKPVAYTIEVGKSLQGKVLDGFGNIIHQFIATEDSSTKEEQISLNEQVAVPIPFKRPIITKTFITGIKAIDLLTPCGIGQRFLICAQPGVGKTTLINMIAQSANMDIVIINLIGERGREVNEFFSSLDEKVKRKSIFIISTADKSSAEKIKSLFTAHIIASWFRSQGYKVLLLVDSITRFARALRETSLTNGAMVVRSYTNVVYSTLAQVFEIAGTDTTGSITAFYTALFEDETLSNDPLIEEIKSVTDGHLVLSRKIAHGGRYPAINFLDSISRIAPQLVNENHLQLMQKIINIYSSYAEFELLIKIGEYVKGSNKEIDNTIKQYQNLNKYFNQSTADAYPNITTLIADISRIIN